MRVTKGLRRVKEPAMPFSHLPAYLTTFFLWLASVLDPRLRPRFATLLRGALFADGRRTVTTWIRAADLSGDFRRAYSTIASSGRQVRFQGSAAFQQLRPLLDPRRLLVAVDDTPTPRYGPRVQGAGLHHNPGPGPAGEAFVYGHVFVTVAALGRHPARGTIALPVWSQLYVRAKNLPSLPREDGWTFRTKLQLAAEQLVWLKAAAGGRFAASWVAADGGYAKREFLRAAKGQGMVVVSRLRKDAALWSVPEGRRRPGQRGPLPVYGKQRISLAKRAGQSRGWQQVACVQYGREVQKTIKTFVATWRPAGGPIRVVLVQEEAGWLALFSTDPEATAVEVLEAAADRGAIEQTFKDVKEVWGAGQQQVRNVWASAGCFNINGWLYSAVERWAWDKPEEELVDRSGSPWDAQERRPSHAEKRKALRRAVLREEIRARLERATDPTEFQAVLESLLRRAA
jgi:DDE superfamily endonuclease